MTIKDAILYSLRSSSDMVEMFTGDLSRQDLHHRVVPEANCAAWILGHLVMGERRSLELLGVAPEAMPTLPFEDFAQRFARDETATAMTDYGPAEVLSQTFRDHRAALIATVEATDEATLTAKLPQAHRVASTVAELLLFFGMHGALHMGQISTIRRSLGRPPVV